MTPPACLNLRAGPLRAEFDPATGFLRRVSLAPHEILRGIYAAVRDRNWGTIPMQLRDLRTDITPESFRLSFAAECRQAEVDFAWQGELHGTADGQVHYALDGQARTSFLRNRIGFCVLHPIRECAGARARQRRTDGRIVECRFPDVIEPQIFGQSSFRDLQAVAHEFAPGLWAEVEFSGDVFEMEDQRNWTDASFKTYCTPLALPFPVEIAAGTRIQQRVTLRLLERAPGATHRLKHHPAPAAQPRVVSLPGTPRHPLPRMGLGTTGHAESLADAARTFLRTLQLSHVRADIRLAQPDWRAGLDRAIEITHTLGVALELAVHLTPHPTGALEEMRKRLRDANAPLARILALRPGEPATTSSTLATLQRGFAGCPPPIGAGTDAHFCELNREAALGHFAAAQAEFLFWPITPQVHAFDDLSIMETLEALPDVVRTARALAGNKPLVISPVTLKPRFNAVALDGDACPAPGELPANVDPRQRSPFTAAWALGVIATLAACGVESLTLFETTGGRGVMEGAEGSPLPSQVFPVGALLRQLAGFERCAPLETPAPGPPPITGLALWDKQGRRRIVLANLTPASLNMRLAHSGDCRTARLLDAEAGCPEASAATGTLLPLEPGNEALALPPYGIVILDTADHGSP